MNRSYPSLLSLALLALTTSATHASVITWGSPTAISGDSDVKTDGTLVGAINVGSASTTVNGVLFGGLTLSGTSVNAGNFSLTTSTFFGSGAFFSSSSAPFINLTSSYQTFLGSGGGDNGPTPFTLTMNALTVGQTYEFQWWSNNSGTSFPVVLTATAGNSVSLSSNPSATVGGLGQYAVGTFTADAASQAISFALPSGGAILNGFQLRQVVPEPGTALFGLALLGVCTLRNRRARS